MHRDVGVPQGQIVRQASTALLTIDSADRFNNQVDRRAISAWVPPDGAPVPGNYSAYDFTISKTESIMNGFFTRLAVSEIVFPWAIPNINVQTNKMLIDVENISTGVTTTYTLTLIPGFYKPAELAAAIEALVRSIPEPLGSFVMEYSPNNYTNCFAYDNTASSVTTFVGFRPVSYNNTIYNNNSQVMQLFDLLGFSDFNSITNPGAVGNATLCQFTRYVDIVCPQLIYNQSLRDTSSQRTVRDALCRVYLGDANETNTLKPSDPNFSPPGCAPVVIYRNFATPKYIQWQPNQPVPGFLQFQVYDDNGVVLSNSGANVRVEDDPFPVGTLYAGLDWSMTLLVSEN